MYAFSMLAILLFSPGWVLLLLVFLAPMLNQIPSIIILEKTNFFTAVARCFSIEHGSYGDALGSFCVFFMISAIFFFVLINPLWGGILEWVSDIVKQIFITVMDDYYIPVNAVNSFFFILFLFFTLGIYFISLSFNYHSKKEKVSARGLFDKLEKFGKRKRTLESEIDFD
jgi:hypothetical protein